MTITLYLHARASSGILLMMLVILGINSLYHSLDNCGCAGDADFRIKFLFVSVRVLSYNSSLSKLCILAVLQHYHTHPFGLLSFLGLVSSPYETTSVSQSV